MTEKDAILWDLAAALHERASTAGPWSLFDRMGPAYLPPTRKQAASSRERQRRRRALLELVAAGLVKVVKEQGRAVHIRPTPEGLPRVLAAGKRKDPKVDFVASAVAAIEAGKWSSPELIAAARALTKGKDL